MEVIEMDYMTLKKKSMPILLSPQNETQFYHTNSYLKFHILQNTNYFIIEIFQKLSSSLIYFSVPFVTVDKGESNLPPILKY